LFVAASCADNPQVYDMRLPPSRRMLQWRTVETQKIATDPTLYAPFTIREFLQIPLDYAYVPLCQNWPVAPPSDPATLALAAATAMPNVPALVLTGDLDTITTPEEGDRAAASFRDVRRIIVRNTGHVTAIDDPWNCASAIVRAFLQVTPLEARCANEIPPLRLVDTFPQSRSDVQPATLRSGAAAPGVLRDARNALDAAGDALARVRQFGSAPGSGLRGGRFTVRTVSNGERIDLDGVRWTADYPVSGSLTFDRRSNAVVANLRAPGLRASAAWNWLTSTQATIVVRGPQRAVVSAPAP
jgi:hypothetical protein